MAIDGLIERVRDLRPERNAIALELAGRTDRNGIHSHAGQRQMTIVNPTWKPSVGMAIWGGGGSVRIEADPPREYKRKGYTRLEEAQS